MDEVGENETWRQFERLVVAILRANDFEVEVNSVRGDPGFDLRGRLAGESLAIEVKYYRTARAQPTLISSAASRLVRNGANAKVEKGMLVVSCELPSDLRRSLEQKFGITFVDRADLRRWAAIAPVLAEELEAVVETVPGDTRDMTMRGDRPRFTGRPLSAAAVAPPESRGAELCKELKAIKKGRDAWADYEKVCARIIRYLFPNDLQGWHKQKRTDDGLNRFDFVCRVRPTTEFWRFLIDHLNSRYILFEFKNYNGKIKQGQMLTTEKYLLDRGLRRAAIIFSRSGADTDAMRMAQGAMREHGKLMLVIDDQKVCEMLHMKDRGDDPTDSLFEAADDFLLRLPR